MTRGRGPLGWARAAAWRAAMRTPPGRELKETRAALKAANGQLMHLRTQVNRALQRLTDIEVGAAASTRRGDPAPSFRYKLAEQRRLGQDLAPALGLADPVETLDPKDVGYEFASRHGLTVPKRYAAFASLEDVDLGGLPERFVLKALDGWSSRGVFLLQRLSHGIYQDLSRRQEEIDQTTLVERLTELHERGIGGLRVIAEELVERTDEPDLPPVDWKLYCFYGRVGMITAKDSRGTREWREFGFRWFNRDWEDLGPARLEVSYDPSIPPPIHRNELIEAGERLSAAIPRPFVRIDFYDRREGLVFGEVTPYPGALHLMPDDVDRWLGQMWEDAAARLWAESVTTGGLDVRMSDE